MQFWKSFQIPSTRFLILSIVSFSPQGQGLDFEPEEDEVWEQVKGLHTSPLSAHQHHVWIELSSTKRCD
jgi:hypothetical protein